MIRRVRSRIGTAEGKIWGEVLGIRQNIMDSSRCKFYQMSLSFWSPRPNFVLTIPHFWGRHNLSSGITGTEKYRLKSRRRGLEHGKRDRQVHTRARRSSSERQKEDESSGCHSFEEDMEGSPKRGLERERRKGFDDELRTRAAR